MVSRVSLREIALHESVKLFLGVAVYTLFTISVFLNVNQSQSINVSNVSIKVYFSNRAALLQMEIFYLIWLVFLNCKY